MNRKFFHTTALILKKTPENLKSKSVSSQQWLNRQINDPYVEKAKILNYRCRSAFKLLEINEKHQFLRPGDIVVDCGAAPGSWTQVAVQKVNSNGSQKEKPIGTVISIDKQQVFPIDGATILGNSDFTTEKSQEALLKLLNNRKPNAVLSDMAPSASGIRQLDTESMIQLCYSVLRFAVQVSEKDATFLCKLWQCGESNQFHKDILRFYESAKVIKPNSSRSDSAEIFIIGKHFKGLKT